MPGFRIRKWSHMEKISNNNPTRIIILLTFTALLWGGNAVASRLAVGNISPMMLTSLRWVAVCAIMPWLLREQLRTHWQALRAHWRLIAVLGTGLSSIVIAIGSGSGRSAGR